MPVRNGEKDLRISLENLIKITKSKDQILVIDDGSTDSTKDILKEFQQFCDRIQVISIPASGIVTALNLGVENAVHEYIARADVDDIYREDRLDLQIEFLDREGDVAAVFSDYIFWNNVQRDLGCMPSAVVREATRLSVVDAFRMAHPSVVYRKSAVIKVGCYLESEFPAEDLGLWLRLLNSNELASIPQPLLHYQVNPSGISSTRREEMLRKKNDLLSALDYNKLVWDHVNSYSDIKNSYKCLDFRYERLALHNIDLLICLYRSDLVLTSRIKILVRIMGRILNPRVLVALLTLLHQRTARK
jgi:glycosyltransferase involved in cell wall biosynthesis